MVLTAKQEEGLRCAVSRYKSGEPWTCIGGYAGSGKSTLVRFIVSALDLLPEEVCYIAFTGKAASVLRHKGCPNAQTAHRLLYESRPLPNGKFSYKPRQMLERDYKLIIVDEISLLPLELWNLLLTHHIPIIACGDPFQLPPIQKETDNHVLDAPHIFLDEIMRQAQESEIIRMTMGIREYKTIPYYKGNEVMVVRQNEVIPGMYTWANQILTATNPKRHKINEYMRQAAGRGPEPEIGDKIIGLRNCWDIADSTGEHALVNGTIGYITALEKQNITYPICNFPSSVPVLETSFETQEDGVFKDVRIDYQGLTTGTKLLTPQQEYQIYRRANLKGSEPIEFNYGYAITTHRAQGSEWPKVLVFEERFPIEKDVHARWLYTACTRASEKLVLVR